MSTFQPFMCTRVNKLRTLDTDDFRSFTTIHKHAYRVDGVQAVAETLVHIVMIEGETDGVDDDGNHDQSFKTRIFNNHIQTILDVQPILVKTVSSEDPLDASGISIDY